MRTRRKSATTELRWIVVAGGLVLKHRWKARVHWLGVANDDMSRFGVMNLCRARRSTKGDQYAQDQNSTHRNFSNRTIPPWLCDARAGAPQLDNAFKITQIGVIIPWHSRAATPPAMTVTPGVYR
jgi:hypothetical protein